MRSSGRIEPQVPIFPLPAASRLSRVGWFSSALAFRSLYYPWGKLETTRSLGRIGPLLPVIHVVQSCHSRDQDTHWHRTMKELTSFKMVNFIVFSQCMFCSPAWRCLYHVEWQINNHSLIPSTDVIQITSTLKMTTAPCRLSKRQSLSTTVLFKSCVHPDDQSQHTYETNPGGSNPGHKGGRQVLSPLHQRCSPNLAHMAIPALGVSYIDLRDMIGSFGRLRAFWLARKIT